MIEWLAITLLVTTLVYAIVIYNRLVRDRQMTLAGWSDIGVQLKRRQTDRCGQEPEYPNRKLPRPVAGAAVWFRAGRLF